MTDNIYIMYKSVPKMYKLYFEIARRCRVCVYIFRYRVIDFNVCMLNNEDWFENKPK